MAIELRYNTTAARIAAVMEINDIGREAQDLEAAAIYKCIAAGAGAASWMPVTAAVYGTIVFSVHDFREVTSGGDVGNVAAIGGVLASDTTPVMLGDAAESQALQWAASNNDIVAASTLLPNDFDGSRDVYIDLVTSSGGTTDAASFTVETGWDGAAIVSDTATGSASTTAAVITATVAAADVPDSPRRLTIMLTPVAHTTDTKLLHGGIKVRYFRK